MNETCNFLFAKMTDWLIVSVPICPSIGCLVDWLPFDLLSYRLYVFIALQFIYQSVFAYLNLWASELMIPSLCLFYSCLCLCIFFLSVPLFLSINSPPPSSDIYLILFAFVSILTRTHLCGLVLPHFITCLTDRSVIKHSALLQIHKRPKCAQ